MDRVYKRLLDIMCRDDGGRGFSSNAPAADVDALRHALEITNNVLIITGFPVEAQDGHICCETDGPIGAAHIARALCEAGKNVVVATDKLCYPQLAAVTRLRAPEAELLLLEKESEGRALDLEIDTVISIERPGKAADGSCHTSKGKIIDGWLFCDTDMLFDKLHARGITTIAIGDGGNELGTGKLMDITEKLVEHGESIAAVEKADITLASGVSNWWGWGIAAVVSMMIGRNVVPTELDERNALKAMLSAGAVDGVTKLSCESVDALSIDKHIEVLNEVQSLVESFLAKQYGL